MKPKKPKAPDQQSVTVGAKSYDAMWADVCAKAMPVAMPPGGKTVAMFAAEQRITVDQADCRLRMMERQGLLHSQKLKIVDAGGRLRPTVVYVPV